MSPKLCFYPTNVYHVPAMYEALFWEDSMINIEKVPFLMELSFYDGRLTNKQYKYK